MEFLSSPSIDIQKDILLYRGGKSKVQYKYHLLDKRNVFKKELKNIEKGFVGMKSLAQIKRTGTFDIVGDDDGIDFINDRIAPFVIFTYGSSTITFPLGILLLASPEITRDGGVNRYRVTCFDGTITLKQDKPTTGYLAALGSAYTDLISELISSLGITNYNIPKKGATLPRAIEYEIGTSKLDIINDLLAQINYTSLYTTNAGYIEARPYVLPEERIVETVYLQDKLSVILDDGATELKDISSVPNRWIGIVSNAETTPLYSIYENNNASDPTSIPSRGRVIAADPIKLNDISDQTTLDDYVKRIAKEQSSIYGNLDIRTSILPVHGYLDKLTVQGITSTFDFIETSWDIYLDDRAYMVHSMRRVVEQGV